MSSYNYPVFGTVFGRGESHTNGSLVGTSGIPRATREADTSVELIKYTDDLTTSGNLVWQYTRANSPHTSVEVVKAIGTLGPTTDFTERKIFAGQTPGGVSIGDWTVFNSWGLAVGATSGTTDTDVTPRATFAGSTSGELV